TQQWRDNMQIVNKPVITPLKEKEKSRGDFTRITFCPDLQKFSNMKSLLDSDILPLLHKRVIDIGGTSNFCTGEKGDAALKVSPLKVFLDGERIAMKNFKEYCQMYMQKKSTGESTEETKDREKQSNALPFVFEHVNDRWEFCVTASDGIPQQISFVNSINT